jgi:hypothetical protein
LIKGGREIGEEEGMEGGAEGGKWNLIDCGLGGGK